METQGQSNFIGSLDKSLSILGWDMLVTQVSYDLTTNHLEEPFQSEFAAYTIFRCEWNNPQV